jgi:hypothetical protein
MYWQHPNYLPDFGDTPRAVIRIGHYKLIHYYGDYLDTRGYLPTKIGEPYGKLVLGEKNQLFNLKRDPGEKFDISKKRPKKTKELLYKLKKWLWKQNAQIPIKNPEMDLSNWYKRGYIKKSRKTRKAERPEKPK